MPRLVYGDLMTDHLWPTYTPRGCLADRQAESMRELRQLRLEGRSGAHLLGERAVALRLHDSLSVHDIARAALMSEEDVQALIAERRAYDAFCKRRSAEDRVRRHRPS